MPRSIDSIVANHQAAAALRGAGKCIWTHKVAVKRILRQDPENESPEHLVMVANQIACALRAGLPQAMFDYGSDKCDADFLDVVELLEGCTAQSFADDIKEGHKPVDLVNGWVELLYDWADANRVWLGD